MTILLIIAARFVP